ncbi:MAG: nitroreductase family deazaflavin-dependent oxidoreductase [Anaerolineae bacterium]|nr:nitroreductase family deazaflavin-dependent oxidoreductase [Anaerolineae bacterium]
MDERIKRALQQDRTIDITTIGRKSGQPRRIEIWFHNLDDRIFITGLPGRRDWYANLKATPEFTFHLKESVQADLPATARAIVDEAERRELFTRLLKKLDRQADFDKWLADSPLVEITVERRT